MANRQPKPAQTVAGKVAMPMATPNANGMKATNMFLMAVMALFPERSILNRTSHKEK
jgi:hypothetical protein